MKNSNCRGRGNTLNRRKGKNKKVVGLKCPKGHTVNESYPKIFNILQAVYEIRVYTDRRTFAKNRILRLMGNAQTTVGCAERLRGWEGVVRRG